MGKHYNHEFDRELLTDLTAASLEAGFVPRDAVKRAREAYDWFRSHTRIRGTTVGPRHARLVRRLIVSAMRAHGPETGVTLAGRGIEAGRLLDAMFREGLPMTPWSKRHEEDDL